MQLWKKKLSDYLPVIFVGTEYRPFLSVSGAV